MDGDAARDTAVSYEERLADLDEILSILVHELRNPLAVIQGFATTLVHAAKKLDPDAVVEAAEAVERGAQRMDALLGTLKEVRSFDFEDIELELSESLISELLQEVVDGVQSISRSYRLSLSIEDDVLVRVDVVRIRQVLTNLLSNAIKFSPKGSEVAIFVSRVGDSVAVEVVDEGTGIPPERVDELFHKFSRLGSHEQGTGLGLYISRGIARAHGGDLELRPDDPAVGCRFVLTLPIHGQAERSLPERRRHLPR